MEHERGLHFGLGVKSDFEYLEAAGLVDAAEKHLSVVVGEGEVNDATIERLEQALHTELFVEDADFAVFVREDGAPMVREDGVGEVLGALVHGDHLAVDEARLPIAAHDAVDFDFVRGVYARR